MWGEFLPRSPLFYHNDTAYRWENSTTEENTEEKTDTVRRILIVGKVGVGKASLANQIFEGDIFPLKRHIESITSPAKSLRREERENVRKYTKVQVAILDTIGQSEGRNPYKFIDELKDFREKLNLIIVVIQIATPTMEEVQQIEHFSSRYNYLSDLSALVITNCEMLNEKARKETVERFKRDPSTMQIAEFMKKGIYTVGFPNPSEIPVDLLPMYEESIKKDKENIHSLLDGCNVSHGISNKGCTLL